MVSYQGSRGAGAPGHSPKPLNIIRISLYYGICKKQEKLSVHKFWIQILSKISSCRLNARMSRYFHLQKIPSNRRTKVELRKCQFSPPAAQFYLQSGLDCSHGTETGNSQKHWIFPVSKLALGFRIVNMSLPKYRTTTKNIVCSIPKINKRC